MIQLLCIYVTIYLCLYYAYVVNLFIDKIYFFYYLFTCLQTSMLKAASDFSL